MFKFTKENEINSYTDALESLQDENIKKSLQKQLKWYCNKTSDSKILFLVFTFFTIAIPAIIPFVNSVYDDAVNLMAAANTIISSWLAFRNYKLSWSRYGQTSELIKREIRHAITKIGAYSDIKEQSLLEKKLFENVEVHTAVENENWIKYIEKKDEKKNT